MGITEGIESASEVQVHRREVERKAFLIITFESAKAGMGYQDDKRFQENFKILQNRKVKYYDDDRITVFACLIIRCTAANLCQYDNRSPKQEWKRIVMVAHTIYCKLFCLSASRFWVKADRSKDGKKYKLCRKVQDYGSPAAYSKLQNDL